MKSNGEIDIQVKAMKELLALKNIQSEEHLGLVSAIQALEWVLEDQSDSPVFANTVRQRDKTGGRTKIIKEVKRHEQRQRVLASSNEKTEIEI